MEYEPLVEVVVPISNVPEMITSSLGPDCSMPRRLFALLEAPAKLWTSTGGVEGLEPGVLRSQRFGRVVSVARTEPFDRT